MLDKQQNILHMWVIYVLYHIIYMYICIIKSDGVPMLIYQQIIILQDANDEF